VLLNVIVLLPGKDPKFDPLIVTDPPTAPDVGDRLVIVGATAFTVCVSTVEVFELKELSPPYTAVMECEPTASVHVPKAAFPLLIAPVPNVVVPSINVTVPVTVVGDNVAVNVTEV
jgi:hypothetical protein